jgi:adenylyltransferase/sulfurtransferase
MGSLMAMEIVREIVGFGESLVGRLLMVDARAMRFDTIRYVWDDGNPLSGTPASSSWPQWSDEPESPGKAAHE